MLNFFLIICFLCITTSFASSSTSSSSYVCVMTNETTVKDIKDQYMPSIRPIDIDLLAMEVFNNIYIQIIEIYIQPDTCKSKHYTLVSHMLDGEGILDYIIKKVDVPKIYAQSFVEYVYIQVAEKFDSVFPGLIYLQKPNGEIFIAW